MPFVAFREESESGRESVSKTVRKMKKCLENAASSGKGEIF